MTSIQCTLQQPCMVQPDGSVSGGVPLNTSGAPFNTTATTFSYTSSQAAPARITDAYAGLDFALHMAGIAAVILACACLLHVTQIHGPFVTWIDDLLNGSIE